ncbi:MAG: FAD-dependent thymidylate synthase [Candidatus Bipolaricaulia bacterium]
MTDASNPNADAFADRRIFAVLGTHPEPGGYGIAKFSRSARPYQDWIFDLTAEGAERFYETFYFDYGHASIADLAHLTVVLENISMVAAEVLWDESLVDGQASSTRYQDFQKRGFHTPPEIEGTDLQGPYEDLGGRLIEAYGRFQRRIFEDFVARYADERPSDMDDAAYERTLNARAFDVARYVLPMSIRTGLGHILSARTLERQLVKLLSHPLAEVREVGAELKRAATEEPAFNPTVERLRPLLDELADSHIKDNARARVVLDEIKRVTGFDAAATPTLVKYAEPNAYHQQLRQALSETADEMAPGLGDPDGARGVQLIEPHDPETEAICSLLYEHLPHSYAQIKRRVDDFSDAERAEILDLVYADRGRHDPMPRALCSGYQLIFDVSTDGGAWRDFHRHRRMIQLAKRLRPTYGYDVPQAIQDAGLASDYGALLDEAGQVAERIDATNPGVGQYALPMAYRQRALFKMDAAQLQYVVELRSRPENHFAVRETAYALYEAFRDRYPRWARHIRAVRPEDEAFFKR